MKLFGMEFAPMDDQDYAAFAGAPDDALIARINEGEVTLIYSPDGRTLTEMSPNGERAWKLYCTISGDAE